ncbi:MAG: hypothetical protein PHT95_04005, partial [Candidatus Omnitrophica bacterium]|nr:hypothetical protein [Candidatus Omnitrophota bacterium]
VVTYTYDEAGTLTATDYVEGTLTNYDSSNRIILEVVPDVTRTEWTYYGTTGQISTKTITNLDTGLVTTYSYYSTDGNRMKGQQLSVADADGNVEYGYLDELYGTQGYGRLAYLIKDVADATGSVAYRYTYHGETGQMSVVMGYGSRDMTGDSLIVTYRYNEEGTLTGTELGEGLVTGYDSLGRITLEVSPGEARTEWSYYGQTQNISEKVETDLDSGLVTTYSYYNTAANRMESQVLSAADNEGNIEYGYLDEDFDGRGYGRMAYSIRAAADDTGSVAYTYTYYGVTGQVARVMGYGERDMLDGSLIVTYTYDEDGTLTGTEYVGGVLSRYDSNGRMILEVDPGVTRTEWTYYGDSNRIHTKTIVTIDSGNVAEVFYYPSETNYPAAIRYSEPDDVGNIYYHFLDENWQGQGYGRSDVVGLSQSDEEGALAYVLDYNFRSAAGFMEGQNPIDQEEHVGYKASYARINTVNPISPITLEEDLLIVHTYYDCFFNDEYGKWVDFDPNIARLRTKEIMHDAEGKHTKYYFRREGLTGSNGRIWAEVNFTDEWYDLIEYANLNNAVDLRLFIKERYGSSDPAHHVLMSRLEYYPNGNLKRHSDAVAITEFLNEDHAGSGRGRTWMHCDVSADKYYVYEWCRTQVIIDVYSGTYQPDRRGDVFVSPETDDVLLETQVLVHKGEQLNLDNNRESPAYNGWLWAYKSVYDADKVETYKFYINNDNRVEIVWKSNGDIYKYSDENISDGMGHLEWVMNVEKGEFKTYEYHTNGNTRYVHVYLFRRGTADTWDYLSSYEYDSGGQYLNLMVVPSLSGTRMVTPAPTPEIEEPELVIPPDFVEMEQTITLKIGWNFVGTFGTSFKPFREVVPPGSIIFSYDPASRAYCIVKDDGFFEPGKGYVIFNRGPEDISINVQGMAEAGPQKIPVRPGWNLIAGPSSEVDISDIEFLNGASSLMEGAWSWDPVKGRYVFNKTLLPGKAYWMFIMMEEPGEGLEGLLLFPGTGTGSRTEGERSLRDVESVLRRSNFTNIEIVLGGGVIASFAFFMAPQLSALILVMAGIVLFSWKMYSGGLQSVLAAIPGVLKSDSIPLDLEALAREIPKLPRIVIREKDTGVGEKSLGAA